MQIPERTCCSHIWETLHCPYFKIKINFLFVCNLYSLTLEEEGSRVIVETLHLCHAGKPFCRTELLENADPNRRIHSERSDFNTMTRSTIKTKKISHQCTLQHSGFTHTPSEQCIPSTFPGVCNYCMFKKHPYHNFH